MVARLQEALCALATDGALRDRLRAEGAPALRGFSLDEGDLQALVGLPPESIDRYARSLLTKRTDELARAIPLSRRVAPSLPGRYRALLAGSPSPLDDSVLGPGLREALRLLGPLRRQLDADEGEAPWAGDLLSLEVLRAASRVDGAVRVARLGHDLRPVLVDLARGLIPTEVARASMLVRCDAAGLRWRAA